MADGQQGVVLLCEDEAIVAMDIQMMIEDGGFEVCGPFSRVSVALDALEDVVPVAAVLDVRLRDGDIFPVAEQLDQAGVPLIFHSGHLIEDEVVARFPRAQHCPKPTNARTLMQALSRAASECVRERAAG
ncbi:response regulator [Sagittula stellata]|uniref:Response regulator, hypothetical n=2 Tax=Sagittula stellata TaxID=52603 RepID=A3K7K0_SAGS3|nr:response regulator [Sagittula stellata]EBA06959.1 response regulator, hypothetical [Sagittula stellata E-37]